MRVLFLIPKAKPPTLEGAFSNAFKDFIALCLIKDPMQRPPAKELLQHRFVKYAKRTSSLVELKERHLEWKVKGGGGSRKAVGGSPMIDQQDTILLDATMNSSWSFDSVRLDVRDEEEDEDDDNDNDNDNDNEEEYQRKLSEAIKTMSLSKMSLASHFTNRAIESVEFTFKLISLNVWVD